MKNVFDFDDLAGVPAELASRLTRDGGEEPALVQEIVDLVLSAGDRRLNIVQIMVAMHKTGMKVPAESTVRNHLNRAVDDGRLGKPTRQSYSNPAFAKTVQEAEAKAEADAAAAKAAKAAAAPVVPVVEAGVEGSDVPEAFGADPLEF